MLPTRRVTLGDVVELQRGYDLPESKRRAGTVPVIGSAGVTGYHDTAKVLGPGVTLGRAGASYGKVTYVPVDFWPHNATLFVKDFKGNDVSFVRYLLESIDFSSINSGAAQPMLNRNYAYLVPINLPALAIQVRVGSILLAYDDLITNCERRVRVLDEMARALYREWFVLFRYPGHEKVPLLSSPHGKLPSGWGLGPLGAVASITMGLSPKGNTYNEQRVGTPLVNGPVEFGERFPKRVKWTTSPTKLCKEGDLIVCVRGSTTGKYVKSDGAYCLGRGVCSISSQYQCFVDQLFVNDLPVLLARTGGSTFPSWTGPQLQSHLVLSPPPSLLAQFETLVRPMSAAVATYSRQRENLRKTRDLLLPRLLSGQLPPEAPA